MRELATEIIGRPLDPDQSPWEMHVIEGFCGDKVALIAKVHHAVIDGVSGVELLAQLLDVSPENPPPAGGGTPWRVPALPSGIQLVSQALPNLLTSPLRALRAAREIGRTSLRLVRHVLASGTAALPVPLAAPDRFAAPIKATRNLSFVKVDLRDVVDLKERFGVTLNDVVLAMCSGALRAYLSERHEETASSLIAVVPVSARPQAEQDALGNRLSAMFVPLASDREAPLDRLVAVADACASAKAQEHAVGFSALASSVSDVVPPVLARPALHLGAHVGALRRLRPANLMISNIPGPRVPLYFAGMRMEAAYPIGPVIDGVALNITVQSYLDSLFVGLNACPNVVPDLDALAGSVVDELGRLTSAARQSTGAVRPGEPGDAEEEGERRRRSGLAETKVAELVSSGRSVP